MLDPNTLVPAGHTSTLFNAPAMGICVLAPLYPGSPFSFLVTLSACTGLQPGGSAGEATLSKDSGGVNSCLNFTESSNLRLFGIRRDLKAQLVPGPCHGQRHLLLSQVAPSPVLLGLEHFLGTALTLFKAWGAEVVPQSVACALPDGAGLDLIVWLII